MAQLDKTFGGSSSGINTFFFVSQSITPAALAASLGMKEEAYTITGAPAMLTTDLCFVTAPPGAVQANCGVVAARVSSATQITNIYANLTAAANVPTAGVYSWWIVRP